MKKILFTSFYKERKMKYLIVLLLASILLSACSAPAPISKPTSPSATPSPSVKPPIIRSPIKSTISSSATSPTSTPNIATKEMQIIKEWKGTGIKTTEPFTITSSPWSIKWTHEPKIIGGQLMGILQIFVYKIDNPKIPLSLLANTMVKEADTSFVYEKGTFFLTINSANSDYTVAVLASN